MTTPMWECPQYQLVLVSHPRRNSREDFAELAEWASAFDRRVAVTVCEDTPESAGSVAQLALPTLVFSPGPLRRLRPSRATVYQGRWLPKSVEYRRLEAVGVPVPDWVILTPGSHPDVGHMGSHIVVKPDLGACGADVRIRRAQGLTWHPPKTSTAKILGGPMANSIVQEFIYTGHWATSYRVTTLFGRVLSALRIEASHRHRALLGPHGFAAADQGAGAPVVSSGRGCTMTLCDDPDVLELAQRAHSGFPDFALLGVDMLRQHDTGRLYVVEVNSAGLCWHFSSATGRRLQAEFGLDLESQFDGRRRAAKLLAEKTVTNAR